MAMPARKIILHLPLSLLLAGPAGAQSLAPPASVVQTFDVVQFGVPRDARFVFCDGEDCPQRSIKHLQPLPSPAPVQSPGIEELVLPVPPPRQAHGKVARPHKPLQKKHRKTGLRYECKPVTRGK